MLINIVVVICLVLSSMVCDLTAGVLTDGCCKSVVGEKAVKITVVTSRVELVTFDSEVLNKVKTFSVVLPADYCHEKNDWPVLFFFHGRGRTERSLIDDKGALASLLKAPFVIILPDGDDGWYIDSPVRKNDRYQLYTEEVIRQAESLYNLSLKSRKRALTGWSMGGYGCMRFAQTHADKFSAVAPIIGLLDFPRIGLPEGQSYDVPVDRFGENEEVWNAINPINQIDSIKDMSIFIITGDSSFDRTMNINFSAALKKNNIEHKWKMFKGGHTFKVVCQAVPQVIEFMTAHFGVK